MTLNDLIKIFNDTKRRTVSLRQLSFLLTNVEQITNVYYINAPSSVLHLSGCFPVNTRVQLRHRAR